MLDDILRRLGALPDAERQEIGKLAATATAHMRFVPNPGAQTMAYLSAADVLLYGGAAGGGKSALMVGLAANEHRRSIILRRESVEVDGIEAFAKEVLPGAGFNGTDLEFSWDRDRSLKLGGCKEPSSWGKYAGRARDFMGFDEAGQFLEEQVASLIAWNRSPDPAQRCRVVLGSNPPRGSEGLWMQVWFAPWLDPLFPNPAKPGELRYAIRVKGEMRWVDGPEPVMVAGEEYRPLSYTFIPAKLTDNPFNDTPEYRARLQSLPEPLRSQLLHGDFGAGREDDEWQVIPTEHIRAAQARWSEPRSAMLAMGVDVAQGGADNTVIAPLHIGNVFARMIARKGIDTTDGPAVASLIVRERRDAALVAIDMSGGWGGSARDHLRTNNEIDAVPVVFGAGSSARDRQTGMPYANLRAEMYWGFRQALDPSSGENVALPPGEDIVAHLASARWSPSRGRVQIESKDEIRARLGVSPDKADAIVIAWHVRERAARAAANRISPFNRAGAAPAMASMGHAAVKKFRR